jgi:hypothetical protein
LIVIRLPVGSVSAKRSRAAVAPTSACWKPLAHATEVRSKFNAPSCSRSRPSAVGISATTQPYLFYESLEPRRESTRPRTRKFRHQLATSDQCTFPVRIGPDSQVPVGLSPNRKLHLFQSDCQGALQCQKFKFLRTGRALSPFYSFISLSRTNVFTVSPLTPSKAMASAVACDSMAYEGRLGMIDAEDRRRYGNDPLRSEQSLVSP